MKKAITKKDLQQFKEQFNPISPCQNIYLIVKNKNELKTNLKKLSRLRSK